MHVMKPEAGNFTNFDW